MNRVLIVDDHRMFAQSLARLFSTEPDFEVVGTAFNGAEGLVAARQTHPEICVLDYQLPDGDGTSLVTQLRAIVPSMRVLLLTGVNRPSTAQAAVSAGCDAFITKDRAAQELIDTLRRISNGQHLIDADVAEAMHERTAAIEQFNLTPRELEILLLLGTGAATTEVAAQMKISSNTVRTHVHRILTKLGAHSKLEAVATARIAGVL